MIRPTSLGRLAFTTVFFCDVQQAFVQGARALPGTRTFLQLSVPDIRGIRVMTNDFSDAQNTIVRDSGVASDALVGQWNLTSRKSFERSWAA